MNIYAIRNDAYKYQELDLEINDIIDDFPEDIDYDEAHEFSQNNLALKSFWPNIRTGFSTIEGSENLIPDISNWINATLLLSPQAYRYLGEILSPFGEFLPVHIGEDIYQIFNCLTTADVIEAESDESTLIFDDSSVSEKVIFKSPFQHCIDIYCGDRLKTLIEDLGLQGVVFDTRLATPFL